MRLFATLFAALLLCVTTNAASAQVHGADLSFYACPGGSGIASDVNLDCAAGGSLMICVTFVPAESSIPDLIAADTFIRVSTPDLNGAGSFWNFETLNMAGLDILKTKPSTGCDSFVSPWTASGSGILWQARAGTANVLGIAVSPYRLSPFAYSQPTKLWGAQLIVDVSTSLESGTGTTLGCTQQAIFSLGTLTPVSASTIALTPLDTPASFGNVVTINLEGLPARRNSWGRLKALYR